MPGFSEADPWVAAVGSTRGVTNVVIVGADLGTCTPFLALCWKLRPMLHCGLIRSAAPPEVLRRARPTGRRAVQLADLGHILAKSEPDSAGLGRGACRGPGR